MVVSCEGESVSVDMMTRMVVWGGILGDNMRNYIVT